MQGLVAKLPNQAARLALILHAFAHPDAGALPPVSAATLDAALALAAYFRAHGRRAFTRFEPAAAGLGDAAMRVLRILRLAGGAWCSRSRLYIDLGGHLPASEMNAALTTLADNGLAVSRTVRSAAGGPGRPGEEWRAVFPTTSPSLHSAAPPREENEENELIPPTAPPHHCATCGRRTQHAGICLICQAQAALTDGTPG